jgi:hypothetical protein
VRGHDRKGRECAAEGLRYPEGHLARLGSKPGIIARSAQRDAAISMTACIRHEIASLRSQ